MKELLTAIFISLLGIGMVDLEINYENKNNVTVYKIIVYTLLMTQAYKIFEWLI